MQNRRLSQFLFCFVTEMPIEHSVGDIITQRAVTDCLPFVCSVNLNTVHLYKAYTVNRTVHLF